VRSKVPCTLFVSCINKMNVDTSLGGVTGPFFEVSEYRSSLNSCRIEWSINLFNRESSIPPGKNTLLWDFSQLRDGKLPILSLRHLHFILVGSSFVVKGMKCILERYRYERKGHFFAEKVTSSKSQSSTSTARYPSVEGNIDFSSKRGPPLRMASMSLVVSYITA